MYFWLRKRCSFQCCYWPEI